MLILLWFLTGRGRRRRQRRVIEDVWLCCCSGSAEPFRKRSLTVLSSLLRLERFHYDGKKALWIGVKKDVEEEEEDC